ncbi:MAG TPA: hypothetical protein VJB82_00315 [Candidatus Peribacterales bacterium]|nr:hypothetical protein [Candidatus Peribacterales bacterium]
MMCDSFINRFFFEPISARPFLRMRTLWAFATFGTLLMQWNDVVWFYSSESFLLLQPDVFSLSVFPRFSLLHSITDPGMIFSFYLALLASLLCVFFGFVERFALIIAVILLHSFHYRNPLPMGGGDVLLYNIGFLLMVTPTVRHKTFARFLVSRFLLRNEQPENKQQTTMPVWPYRLLLFQIIILYLSSLWWKLLGETWMNGTAVEIAFRNPEFARFIFPPQLLHLLSPILSYGTMLFELCWILLLIPRFKYHERLKATLIIIGIFFHLGIAVFLEVGSFGAALFVAYLGLWSKHGGTHRTTS